jgi:hypothetical protein
VSQLHQRAAAGKGGGIRLTYKLILRQFFMASTAKSELILLVWFSISIFLIRNQAGLALSPNFRVFP